jgi:hypothetical protein
MSKSSSDFAKEASKVLCCSQTGKVHVMFDALLLPQRLASESLGKQQTPEGRSESTVEPFTYSQQQSSGLDYAVCEDKNTAIAIACHQR